MKKPVCPAPIIIALAAVIVLSTPAAAISGNVFVDNRGRSPKVDRTELEATVWRILDRYDQTRKYDALEILHPYNHAVFPFDIASPTIEWKDGNTETSTWLIVIGPGSSSRAVFVLSDRQKWRPGRRTWETVKRISLEKPTEITVLGISEKSTPRIVSKDSIFMVTSEDRVRDLVFYVHVPPPFVFARDNPEKIRWRLGDISSYKEPETILADMPSCGNCHSLTQFRIGKRPKSFGLFPRISPDGKYEAGSVKVKSVLVILENLFFSEFLYHASGRIGFYSETDTAFRLLNGADSPDFIQTHPDWSPDGKHIVFARAGVNKKLLESMKTSVVLKGGNDKSTKIWNKRYPVKYDICRVPFNSGKGGTPEMLKGASQNGMSNFFPRYSPDGRWIVYTQAENGLIIQPSGMLFIIPAEGGTPRRMKCNTDFYNSFHNWSSNSRWLIFTSKKNTPYTELFLAHVDENGQDSPPVLLERLNTKGYAAVAPEFVRK